MSVLNTITPLASVIRPMIGLGVAATLLMVFKPLLSGLLRAGVMLLTPRETVSESKPSRLRGILQLNAMARELDSTQPSLAAELRNLAARDY